MTIYATLGDEALIYGINESEANIIITDFHLIPKLKELYAHLHFIDSIVYFGDVKKASLVGFPKDVEFHSSRELDELGGRPQHCMFNYFIYFELYYI